MTMQPAATTHAAFARANNSLGVRVGAGFACGVLLGALARAWMRFISDDPDFTWSGSLFIAGGFAVFGAAQAFVGGMQHRHLRRHRVAAVRAVGVVSMLPLFVAAGAPMAPTVILGTLALARTTWPWWIRLVCAVAAAVPLLLVAGTIVDTFDWSLHAIVGCAGLVALYAAIILMARATMTPFDRPERRPLTR